MPKDHLGTEINVGDKVVGAYRAGNSGAIEIRYVGKIRGSKVQLSSHGKSTQHVGPPVNTHNLVVINENLMDS